MYSYHIESNHKGACDIEIHFLSLCVSLLILFLFVVSFVLFHSYSIVPTISIFFSSFQSSLWSNMNGILYFDKIIILLANQLERERKNSLKSSVKWKKRIKELKIQHWDDNKKKQKVSHTKHIRGWTTPIYHADCRCQKPFKVGRFQRKNQYSSVSVNIAKKNGWLQNKYSIKLFFHLKSNSVVFELFSSYIILWCYKWLFNKPFWELVHATNRKYHIMTKLFQQLIFHMW